MITFRIVFDVYWHAAISPVKLTFWIVGFILAESITNAKIKNATLPYCVKKKMEVLF